MPDFRTLLPSRGVTCAGVTIEGYWAACDALAKGLELEAAKQREGPEVLAAWWRVAEPRWRALNAVLDRVEAADWVRSVVWFARWRDARARGVAPGTGDATSAPARRREEAAAQRAAVLAPRPQARLFA